MRIYLTALFAALLLAPAAHAYVPATETEEPTVELVPISDAATPAVLTGATTTTPDRVKSEGRDDQRDYVSCSDGKLYAVPRANTRDFIRAMTALGYTCELVPAPPPGGDKPVPAVDPRAFDLNGDTVILWSCSVGNDVIPAGWLGAPWNIFQTDPEITAGLVCVPVADY